MADQMYAWSRILYGAERNDQGEITGVKAFEIGDPVSASDLGVSDEVFQAEMVDTGVVQTEPLPDDLKDPFRSPRQLMQDKLVAVQQGFDASGPTADLLVRFDNEGNVKSEEELAQAIDQQSEDAKAAAYAEFEASQQQDTTPATPSTPPPATNP